MALLGCSSNTSSIKLKIEKELEHDINNGIVLLISENNCISCFEDHLYSWIDYADLNNIELNSLFLSSNEIPIEFKELINNTKIFIKWKTTKSIDIFELASKTTKKYSPFVIVIKQNNIVFIDRLIPAEKILKKK